jgi:hypothetical protein
MKTLIRSSILILSFSATSYVFCMQINPFDNCPEKTSQHWGIFIPVYLGQLQKTVNEGASWNIFQKEDVLSMVYHAGKAYKVSLFLIALENRYNEILSFMINDEIITSSLEPRILPDDCEKPLDYFKHPDISNDQNYDDESIRIKILEWLARYHPNVVLESICEYGLKNVLELFFQIKDAIYHIEGVNPAEAFKKALINAHNNIIPIMLKLTDRHSKPYLDISNLNMTQIMREGHHGMGMSNEKLKIISPEVFTCIVKIIERQKKENAYCTLL